MKKILLIAILWLNLVTGAAAQHSFVHTYFPDTISIPTNHVWKSQINDLVQTSDSGYLATGTILFDSSHIQGPGFFSRPFLLKTNKYGVKQWFKYIYYGDATNAYNVYENQIVDLKDSTYILKNTITFGPNYQMTNIARVNKNGTVLWQKNISNADCKMFLSNDNNVIFVGRYNAKINKNTGYELWWKYNRGNIAAVCNGGFVVVRKDSSIVKFNEQGDSLTSIKLATNPLFTFGNKCTIKQTDNGNFTLLAQEGGNQNTYSMILYTLTNNLGFLSKTTLQDVTHHGVDGYDYDYSSSIFIQGNGDVKILNSNTANTNYEVLHFNNDGTGRSEIDNHYTYRVSFSPNKFISTNDRGFVIAGYMKTSEENSHYLTQSGIIKLNAGVYAGAKLNVLAYNDLNTNCVKESNEAYLNGLLYKLKLYNHQTDKIQSLQTDGQGHYYFYINNNTYSLGTSLNTLWHICNDSIQFTDLSLTNDTLVIGIQAAQPCAALEVSVGNDRMRRCDQNKYYLRYANSGTIAANDAYIDLKLDDYLSFDSASVAATALGNHRYRFQVGRVASLVSGTVVVYFKVDCNAAIGQMHCTEATIRPHLQCNADALWDKSQIQVTAECDDAHHAAQFYIKNIGTGNMAIPRNWIVIEDDIMGRGGLYRLNAGQSDTIRVDSVDSDAIYRLLVNQDPNHPSATMATAVTWCANGSRTHWQYVNQMAQNNSVSYDDVNCTQNRSSYDPNEKSVIPEGIGDNHAIPKNTLLKYKIQFQNTGNDTAYLVSVTDQLSANLDWTTFKAGASSHNYTYVLDANGLLTFTFANINLLDSLHHEPKSHGFVQFTIQQKADLPNGTTLDNTANIYFDNNTPVITNTVSQTIGQQWATIVKTPVVIPIPRPNAVGFVLVYPNPISDECHFMLKDSEGKTAIADSEARLEIVDVLGRNIINKAFDKNKLTLNRSDFNTSSGILFYTIRSNGTVIGVGKLLLAE